MDNHWGGITAALLAARPSAIDTDCLRVLELAEDDPRTSDAMVIANIRPSSSVAAPGELAAMRAYLCFLISSSFFRFSSRATMRDFL